LKLGDNELWAWGLGNDFQLGNGKQAITAPVKIDLTHFQQKRLIQLKSGWAHTIALVQEEEQHEQKKAHSSISNQ
jgi:alpha-tubulin suppressor-like RCC1 family protein